MPTYLSSADAARVLGVTPATVRAMERDGRLPALTRTQGGIRLFRSRDVVKLARERARKGGTHGRA